MTQAKNALDFSPDFKSYINLVKAFEDVVYFDKDHSYEIGGIKTEYSVTKLLSKYKKPFDAEKMSKIIAKKEHINPEHVLEKWDFTRDYANHKGTEFHLFVENFLERRKTVLDSEAILKFFESRPHFLKKDSINDYYKEIAKMISNFYKFYEWYKKDHVLIKSEFVLGDKSSGLAGTLDNLSYNTQKEELVIFDYKTNKEIKMKNKYGETLLSPLDHLDNCEYNIYGLQLWLYKLMIEKNTQYSVGNCHIVWFAGNEYKVIDVPDLRREAALILSLEGKK